MVKNTQKFYENDKTVPLSDTNDRIFYKNKNTKKKRTACQGAQAVCLILRVLFLISLFDMGHEVLEGHLADVAAVALIDDVCSCTG